MDTALAAISIVSTTNTPVKLCSVAKTGAEGIALQSSAQLILDACTVQDTTLSAISIIETIDTVVTDCIVNDAGANGFDIQGILGTPSTGISVINSSARNSIGDGFLIRFSLIIQHCLMRVQLKMVVMDLILSTRTMHYYLNVLLMQIMERQMYLSMQRLIIRIFVKVVLSAII